MHAGDKRPLTFAVLPIIEEAYVPPTISRQVTYLPCLALPSPPCLTLPYLILLTLPYLTLPYLTLPYLTLPYLTFYTAGHFIAPSTVIVLSLNFESDNHACESRIPSLPVCQ